MSLYKHFDPNPTKQRVGDCTVRAICKATGKSWEQVFVMTPGIQGRSDPKTELDRIALPVIQWEKTLETVLWGSISL